MKALLRWLFQKNKQYFTNLVMHDWFKDMPETTVQPAIALHGEQRNVLQKLYQWQAYMLHRQMAFSEKDSQFLMGMLSQIRLQVSLIERSTTPQAPGVDKVTPMGEYKQSLEEATKGVQDFRKKQKVDA